MRPSKDPPHCKGNILDGLVRAVTDGAEGESETHT